MYCTDRTHLVCGHQFSNCYPLTCTHLALRQCLMKRPPTDLTCLRETGSTLDIWLVPYKVAGGVSVSLHQRCEDVCNGGPQQGCSRDNCGIGVVACFRRIESGSFLETPSSHVKIAKDKVERRFQL